MIKRLALSLCLVFLAACAPKGPNHAQSETQVLAKDTASWDGQKLPPYPKGDPEITVLKITVPAHASVPLHQHMAINAGYLLSGELTVITDKEETLELKAGEALVEVVNKWHYAVNEGDKDAQIVVFYAGESGKPITLKDDK